MSNKKQFKFEDVPAEVIKVWAIQHFCETCRTGVGSKLWKECQEIINKYPEWFPDPNPSQKTLDPIYDDENPEYIKNTEDGI